jgi:plastocyanin
MRTSAVLCCLFFLLSLAAAQAHDVSGTVQIILKGDKPKSDISAVIVYLELPENVKAAPSSRREYEMATKNKQFSPRAVAVPVGAAVNFPNSDPIYHNIFSVSAPNQFDLGLYKGGESKTKIFEAPGIVRVFCNVHPQMTATIIVANTPYFTTADKQGAFSFGNIPDGNYLLKAYADEGQSSQRIEVKDAVLNVTVKIDARNYKQLPHKNKFGKDYSADENERY